MVEQTGTVPSVLLDKPELNVLEGWIYSHFLALSRDRRYSEVGPLPITLQEIAFYYRLHNEPLTQEDVRWIHALDDYYLAKAQDKLKKASSPKASKSKR